MSSINIISMSFVILLRKIHSLLIKIHAPKTLINFFGHIHFSLMMDILQPYFNKALCNINNIYYKGNGSSKIIWVFWWQGYKQMPLIVKKCVKSIRCHAGNHKVILLTKNNIYDYTNIPMIIYKKLRNGKITLTHFSDIVRFNLLNNLGGLWCDATLYCTSSLNHDYFTFLYTTRGYRFHGTRFINGINGRWDPEFVNKKWTGFLIGGDKNNALFQFMCSFFNIYWKYNRYQIDYFLIDLGLYYSYVHNIGEFRSYVDNVSYNNNPNLFLLEYYLNRTYDLNTYKMITKNTNMFKLTYKKKFHNNKFSFYHYLLKGKLYRE